MRQGAVGFLLALLGSAAAQEITYTKTASLSFEQVRQGQAKFAQIGLKVAPAYAGIDLFKVTYPSTGFDGQPRMLTGLLAVPTGGTKKGIVLFCHGTTWDRAKSPSRFTGEANRDEASVATFAFATGNYAVLMPDYLGLGDDSGVHPYPYSDLNSRSGIDLLKSVRAKPHPSLLGTGEKNFVTGYSEGGAVAMWVARNVEKDGGPFEIEATAPLSGPYDLSGTTAKSLLAGKLSLENLAAKLYLSSYVAYAAMTYIPGVNLNDYFAPSFASYVPFVFKQELGDMKTVEKLTIKAFELGAFSSINKIVTAPFRSSIVNENLTDPIIKKMSEQNCYSWTPKGPMLLAYLTNDTVVVPGNTVVTLAAMRGLGVGEGRLRSFGVVNPSLTHLTASPQVIAVARKFFDGGFAAVPIK